MPKAELSHMHLIVPGTNPAMTPAILLHGSGGSERDLLALASELAPTATALAIRGTASFDDGFAFFHRRPDRSIDETDLLERIPILAAFVAAERGRQNLAKPPIAIGFSNGAIMAAALLLIRPDLLAGAILFRPLSPFIHDPPVRLDGIPVLIIDGEKDSRRSPGDGAKVAERMRRVGAAVTHHVLPVGHAITDSDKQIARDWLTRFA
jgi:phospholipase/carboxylesterase